MSSVYNLEPPPTGKCVLHTTSGDLELELFANQAPLACRSFLQHCLDGYYDSTIFHRLVPGFILQGGDPSGTGSGGQSALEDGRPFADEIHSRLKFNRRGLLGMANGGAKDDNGSQFFLTLGKTDELNGKHTMFGRIQGDTIYNLVKMGEAELVDDGDRPVYPTKITGAEVLVNPFEDMKKRVADQAQTQDRGPVKKKAKKKNAKQLLSFDTEDGEEAPPPAKKSKANPKFAEADKLNLPERIEAPKPEVRKPVARPPPPPSPRRSSRSPSISDESESEPELPESKRDTSMAKANAQIEAIKKSLRGDLTAPPKEEASKRKTVLESLIPETATRGRKRKAPGASNSSAPSRSEQQALDQFNAFKAQLDASSKDDKSSAKKSVASNNNDKSKESNGAGMDEIEDEENVCDLHFVPNCQSCKQWDEEEDAEYDEDEGDASWMTHKLTFAKDRLGKDLEWKRQNEQIMEVFDPKTREKDFKAARRKERIGSSRQ